MQRWLSSVDRILSMCGSRAPLRFASSSSSAQLSKKTCLHDLHVKHGGKMVPFAGYSMPVQYAEHSIGDSAIHTRANASIFDVSHMLQTEVRGADREAFLESLTPADLKGLPVNTGSLSVFTNDRGGIRDDLTLFRTDEDYIYVVTNAGCIDKDLPYLQENAANWRSNGKDVEIYPLEGRGLVAAQGPEMAAFLQEECSIDLSTLYFMHTAVGSVFGVEGCRVTRCGYTGEDGVEISVDPAQAPLMVERMLSANASQGKQQKAPLKLAGLGARDVLRLEAGLCLYGNDITEDTTPIEAALSFVIAKRRRETGGFPGADRILEQLSKKSYPKRRVGLVTESGRRAPRSHLPINDPMDKAAVGFVTSGCPSPCLRKNIAMGYVDKQDAKEGRVLEVDFGGRVEKITVCKLPFIPTHYYMKPKG